MICATCAFGMGIDKGDVDFVAHLTMTSTVDAYFQESGRCGRDGRPAFALSYYSVNMLSVYRNLQLNALRSKFIKNKEVPPPTEQLIATESMRKTVWNLKQVQQYPEPKQCRRCVL